MGDSPLRRAAAMVHGPGTSTGQSLSRTSELGMYHSRPFLLLHTSMAGNDPYSMSLIAVAERLV